MEKRHFEEIAKGLREKVWDKGQRLQAAHVIAQVAQEINPKFDSFGFFEACGLVANQEVAA